MVESGDNLLDLAAIRLDHERLARVIDDHVAKDAALRVKQESIHPASGGKIANVVGHHTVQPAHAVAAGERNPRP